MSLSDALEVLGNVNGILPNTDKIIGKVVIAREVIQVCRTEYLIYELKEPTKNGSTHVVVGHFGECLALLSKDAEGVWLEDFILTPGEIEYFFDL